MLMVSSPTEHAEAATIWTGPQIAFTKPAFADPTLAANQDRMTGNVWITRASTQGIYNAAAEGTFGGGSPADTEWAFGTTANLGSLAFTNWQATVNNNPPTSVGEDMVVHLIADDIFVDIRFTDWGEGRAGGGGSFAYVRSTPIPEPTTAALLIAATALLYRPRH